MRRAVRLAVSLAALALAFTACSKKTPVTPVTLVPPKVLGVQPPARSAGFLYDGQIWALFDRALDPKSVDSTSVFLKQDTQRVPSAIAYESLNKRIVIIPRVTLQLSKAYTVVISSRVRGKDGVALGADFSWQFSTNSIRRVTYLLPATGVRVSPVTAMQWLSPDGVPGNLVYDVYAGTDSVAVAERLVPVLFHGVYNFYLPRAYWTPGVRNYWAVTTTNLVTGERLVSPVASFDVYPADAPTFETVVPMLDHGGVVGTNRTQYCGATTVPVGPNCNAGVRFSLSASQFGPDIAKARLTMTATNAGGPITGMGLWYATTTWTSCSFAWPGPPLADPYGLLAMATTTTGSDIVFESAGLGAFVEGAKRFTGYNGFLLSGTSGQVNVNINTAGFAQPSLVVTSYR